MPLSLSGVVSSTGEQLVGREQPERIWRPTIRVARLHPRPDGPAEENVSLLLENWFPSVPWPEHRVVVSGEWHDEAGGRGYLVVDEYTDTSVGATFSRSAGPGSGVTVSGTISEWRDLTIAGLDATAFSFTLVEDPDHVRPVAFRGRARSATRGLADGVDVEVSGRRDGGGVLIPRQITFNKDPRMPAWVARRGSVLARSVFLFCFAVVLAVVAVLPWVVGGFPLPVAAAWTAICAVGASLVGAVAIRAAVKSSRWSG